MGGLGGCRECWAAGHRCGICRRCLRRRFATGGRSEGRMATEMVTDPARSEILRRIRAAKGGVSSAETARTAWDGIERSYLRNGSRPVKEVLELLEDRLRDYDARVMRVREAEVATAVAKMMGERGVRRV